MGTLQASLSLTAKVLDLGSLKQICYIVPHKIRSTQSHDKQWGNTATVTDGWIVWTWYDVWKLNGPNKLIPETSPFPMEQWQISMFCGLFFPYLKGLEGQQFWDTRRLRTGRQRRALFKGCSGFPTRKLVLLPILPDTRTLHAISCRGLWLCGCALEEWEVWWQFCLHGQPGLQRSLMFSKRR